MEPIKHLVRDVPDFPEPGVVFKDITPLLADAAGLAEALHQITLPWKGKGITRVAGIESRGFILAVSVAAELGAGFIPVRKKGKLPWETISETYDLEYGTDTIEVHRDAAGPDDRVLVVDDVIATGGTAAATVRLLRRLGAEVVGMGVLVELSFLDGRSKLDGIALEAVLTYGD